MKKTTKGSKIIQLLGIMILSVMVFAGCQSAEAETVSAITGEAISVASVESTDTVETVSQTGTSVASEMFTERDLEQTADLSEAVEISLVDDEDVLIVEAGVYVLSGDVTETTIIVEVSDEDNVQLVLDDVTIINTSTPAIYVKSADKVFVTTTDSDNTLQVTGTYEADGDTNTDAVIFSKSDLVLNGTGALSVYSAEGNGISSKDDLKVTGGTYEVVAYLDGLEANDSIRVYDGLLNIVSNKDAMHSENEEDSSLGYIYITGGVIQIQAADDGIRANTVVQIDGGEIVIEICTEGIEATYIQINDGDIDIYAVDDGINATQKVAGEVAIEVNGGNIVVEVGSGDTDAFDANGNIYINGGTIDVTSQMSSFDADGTAELNGGTVTVNGEIITSIASEGMGGMNGRPGKGGR